MSKPKVLSINRIKFKQRDNDKDNGESKCGSDKDTDNKNGSGINDKYYDNGIKDKDNDAINDKYRRDSSEVNSIKSHELNDNLINERTQMMKPYRTKTPHRHIMFQESMNIDKEGSESE